MSNPERYFVETRKSGSLAVKGAHKERAARVVTTENQADRLAHHFAGKDGVVDYKNEHGKFTHHCTCPRCNKNR